MSVKAVLCIFAFLGVAAATPSIPGHGHSHHCEVNSLKSFDIANGTIADIGEDPLIPFSSPKHSAINDTVWEFWFFDATTDDGDAGISIAFWRDNSHVGADPPPLGVLRLQTQVVFPNGTHWIETSWVAENTVTVCKDATTGIWKKPGYEYSFKTSTNHKYTSIVLDSPTLKGTYNLTASAPPVYPDGNYWPSKHASAKVMPLVYWNAGVPSGKVNVDMDIAGTRLNFTGIGGFDRNWGVIPLFQASLGFQYGRLAIGPYSVLFWLVGSKVDRQTYLDSVVIKSNKVVFTTKNYRVVPKKDYMLFGQTHVNDTSIPFDPTKARTTYTVEFVSGCGGKSFKFETDFADPEWAIHDRGFGGTIPRYVSSENVVIRFYPSQDILESCLVFSINTSQVIFADFSATYSSASGGEVGGKQYTGVGNVMHAEFDPVWV
ncbi:hypothetical protein VTL71DRAFT_3631 [Oculimacula yallundae]|uniref:Diels-Alderase N-terminal domain-containing protein n=1 Tax=Oculimacula yallundae TaxID=86028 RepID=A0ABR4C8Z7_9HELO